MTGSRVLEALARAYESRRAGRTGAGERDLILDYEELLERAHCRTGEMRAEAELQLAAAHKAGVLNLIRHKRDAGLIEMIRFSPANEKAFYEHIGRPAPTQRRHALAAQFSAAAANVNSAEAWRPEWQSYCQQLSEVARNGGSVAPFDRLDLESNRELLDLLPRLLSWKGESLMRFASCVLCGDSKRLGELRAKVETALRQLSGGKLDSLDQLGIIENPRSVLLHGPLRLRSRGEWLDIGILQGPSRISAIDIEGAEAVETKSSRCLTVENETTFHELAKLNSGTLLIQTSYPGSGTLTLLERLPADMEFWHFGDTDPKGFDILRDLRQRSDLPFGSLQMTYRPDADSLPLDATEIRLLKNLIQSDRLEQERNELERMLNSGKKGRFEQESLGRPQLTAWPFYE